MATHANSNPQAVRPRVLIIGAGFGGLEAAVALRRASARITVIDRRNYMLFQPLLYQVATAALSPAEVAVPIRALLRSRNTEIHLDELIGIDCDRSCVRTAGGREWRFDYLVLATGSRYDYFGHGDWSRLAPSPKSLSEALDIRSRLLSAFEQAELCEDEARRRELMTVVVVGGGSTGVEMAGAIAELARATLAGDFRRIDPACARIILVEAGPRILATFSPNLGAYAERALTKLGVEVRLNTRIDEITETGVVAGGERITARVVIWAAGVAATPVAHWLGLAPTRHGAVSVRADFSIPGHPNIFVIGDAASAPAPGGKPLPGLAAVAKQQGRYVGELIRRRLEGKTGAPAFRYRDYGTMATIGRSSAVADLRGFQLRGWIAWVLWGLVHIYFLIGFRNRLVVLVSWLWIWATSQRGARLITDPPAAWSTSSSQHEEPPSRAH